MKRQWKEIARGDKRAQWAGMYVTLNSKGSLVMNRATHERLDSPEAFKVLFDEANNAIGLKPTVRALKNAYPAAKSGRHGGRRVNVYRLLTENDIYIKDTLTFPDAEIDADGILVLNMRTAEVSKRVLNHPTRRISHREHREEKS